MARHSVETLEVEPAEPTLREIVEAAVPEEKKAIEPPVKKSLVAYCDSESSQSDQEPERTPEKSSSEESPLKELGPRPTDTNLGKRRIGRPSTMADFAPEFKLSDPGTAGEREIEIEVSDSESDN